MNSSDIGALYKVVAVVATSLNILLLVTNRKNRINRWLTAAAFLASLSIYKHILLNHSEQLCAAFPSVFTEERCLLAYALMAWVSRTPMTVLLVYAIFLYFRAPNSSSWMWRLALLATVVNAVALTVAFPPHIPWGIVESDAYWMQYGLAHIVLSISETLYMVRSCVSENDAVRKKQKTTFTALAVPILFLDVVSFVPRMLNARDYEYYNVWRTVLPTLTISIIAVVIFAFRYGFMGLRLVHEHYDWASRLSLANQGAVAVARAVNRRAPEIDARINRIAALYGGGAEPEELRVIRRSLRTLEAQLGRYRRQTETIEPEISVCRLRPIIEAASEGLADGVHMDNRVSADDTVLCDPVYTQEAITNILVNATEAMDGQGTISIGGAFVDFGRRYALLIRDTGTGFHDVRKVNAFEPFQTTKNHKSNYGLGLSYCHGVMVKQGGSVRLWNASSGGAVVSLVFRTKSKPWSTVWLHPS